MRICTGKMVGRVLDHPQKRRCASDWVTFFLVASSPCVDTTAARVRSRRAAGGRMVACGWPATRPAARASRRLLLLLSSRARSAGSRDDGARARLCCRWGEFVGCRLVPRHGAAPAGWYCVCHLGLGGPLGVLRLTSRFPQALARRPPCERSCKPARRSSVAQSSAPGAATHGFGAGAWRAAALGTLG